MSFRDILGIGAKKEEELKKMGAKTLSDLKKKKYRSALDEISQLYLEYNPERQIPHALIAEMEEYFHDLIDMTITGSYRRQEPFCRDLDVVILSTKAVIMNFIVKIKGHIYSIGESKISLFFKWKTKYYKMDIFIANKENYTALILYSTGSKENNIKMRSVAKSKGLLLNQNGLFENGKLIELKTEKAYYEYLGMKYLQPKER